MKIVITGAAIDEKLSQWTFRLSVVNIIYTP